ncbi:MFS transporter permease [Leucobacter insecticola]|uniref:MFS transporter permease n=1 Tax=Leucobacter insecticola TaxID=2714934 RepID=A0A6G8FJM8_9MICO|nr:MFS transporter permease [Leucobacter insecticola]QIM16489.1 MFS transporter permease [Leucobacter insecticola]
MWLRRAMYLWLFPAAFVLPMWLLIGWGVFGAGGWVFLWVLFVAIPSVFLGQLLMAFLVRSRPSVRRDRALSWPDVAGFAVWHVLVILVGCYVETWFPLALTAAIVSAALLLWSSLRQLRREAAAVMSGGFAEAEFTQSTGFVKPGEVLIVTDAPQAQDTPPARP